MMALPPLYVAREGLEEEAARKRKAEAGRLLPPSYFCNFVVVNIYLFFVRDNVPKYRSNLYF